jgi:hypothetical protein
MNHDELADIQIVLHGNFHYFVEEDAADLVQWLAPHFQPRFRVSSGVVHYYLEPGALLPPDMIIQISEYLRAYLDDVAISVLANALYETIRSFVSRSQRLNVSVDIQIVEERVDPGAATQPVEEGDEAPRSFHGQKLVGRIRGRAHSVDTIKKLLEEARRGSR